MKTQSLRNLPLRSVRFVAGMARLFLYVAVVGAIVGFFLVRSVSAHAGEQGFALGRELAQFQDLLGGAHQVLLNGQPIYVASAISDESVGQVLDRFESNCAKHSGGLASQFDSLPPDQVQRLAKTAPFAWSHRLGIFREERDGEASIACLERPSGDGIASLARALKAFAVSGDLREIGNLRYAYVRKTNNGKVSVISSFTEGSFRLYDVLGKGREEPTGEDPPATPRPPLSKRRISAAIDSSYGAYVFESTAEPDAIMAFYASELPKAGWSAVVAQRDLEAEVWQRDGRTMVVHASHLGDDPLTQVVFSQGRTISQQALR